MKANTDLNLKESVIERVHEVGKVNKAKGKRHKNVELNREEKAEIKEYLTKLQTIVPFMPKHKKLSKVEVISYAIDYIRDLRVTLGLSPCDEDETEFGLTNSNEMPIQTDFLDCHQNLEKSSSTSPQRTPLCVISTPSNVPNTSFSEIQEGYVAPSKDMSAV